MSMSFSSPPPSNDTTTGAPIPIPTVSPAEFIRGKADVAKLVMSGLMFVAVMVATVGPAIGVRQFRDRATPVPSRNRRRFRYFISCMNCFAGGVFLATGILDVLPDAIEDIDNGLKAYNSKFDYPVAHFCLLVGFFILLTIEQIVACCTYHTLPANPPTEHSPLLLDPQIDPDTRNWHSASLTASMEGVQAPVDPNDPTAVFQRQRRRSKRERTLSALRRSSIHGQADERALGEVSRYDRSVLAESLESQEQHDHFVEMLVSGGSPIRSMFLIGAMSVHSLFEGLTLGLEETDSSIYQLMAAICLHKVILSMAIGLSLGQTQNISTKLLVGGSLIFALGSPIGTLIGMSLRFEASKGGAKSVDRFKLVSGILEGTACGTFIYVTFFEILPREINEATRPRQRTLYMIFLLVGFGLMSVLVYWA